MRPCRKCPRCNADVKVTKTITPVEDSKLQIIKCGGCGLTGHVTVTSKVTWNYPPVTDTGQT